MSVQHYGAVRAARIGVHRNSVEADWWRRRFCNRCGIEGQEAERTARDQRRKGLTEKPWWCEDCRPYLVE